jgi:hypothetical protein
MAMAGLIIFQPYYLIIPVQVLLHNLKGGIADLLQRICYRGQLAVFLQVGKLPGDIP